MPITYTAFHLPSALAIGDVDHDGLNDVVVTHDAWQTLSVYTQTVSGTLSTYATAPIPYSDRYRPDALGLADLDGNGSLDVALVDRDHGLVILTNTLNAPEAVIVSPTHASLRLPGPVTVTGNTSSGALTVEVRLKGHTDWLTTTLNGTNWAISLTLPAEERAWWIEARAIDAQGYVQSPVNSVRIGVEDGPPRGDIIINDGAYATNQPTVTLTLPAYDVGGVKDIRFSPDGDFFSDWITYTLQHTQTLTGMDGAKTLYVQFRDVNDNVSALASDNIILDTIVPTSAVTVLPATSSRTTLTITWSGIDTGSGIAFYDLQMRHKPTATWSSLLYQTPLTQTALGLQINQTYCFRSRATDRATNTEAWPVSEEGDGCVVVIRRGVEIAPVVLSKDGGTGDIVTYVLTVTNTGSMEDTINLTTTMQTWTTTIFPVSTTLASMATTQVTVSVAIPLMAEVGMSDTVMIWAMGTEVSHAAQLTTTAFDTTHYIYLPLVLRDIN